MTEAVTPINDTFERLALGASYAQTGLTGWWAGATSPQATKKAAEVNAAGLYLVRNETSLAQYPAAADLALQWFHVRAVQWSNPASTQVVTDDDFAVYPGEIAIIQLTNQAAALQLLRGSLATGPIVSVQALGLVGPQTVLAPGANGLPLGARTRWY